VWAKPVDLCMPKLKRTHLLRAAGTEFAERPPAIDDFFVIDILHRDFQPIQFFQ
jgi:hypothetical protein